MRSPHELDPYVVLGVDATADPAEVRAAFRRAVRRLHPDTASAQVGDGELGEVLAAYRQLADPVSRARYDAGRERAITIRESSAPRAGDVCQTCQGRGAVRATRPCASCRGLGEVTVLGARRARIVWCRRCWGSGYATGLARCAECEGSETNP